MSTVNSRFAAGGRLQADLPTEDAVSCQPLNPRKFLAVPASTNDSGMFINGGFLL